MKKSARFVLQIGLAVTFIAIGFMILGDPIGWGSFIQPWAEKLIPGDLETAMKQTAYLDIAIGIMFLISPTVWIASLLGALHLVIVLVTSGIPGLEVTIRDVGLLAATTALAVETIPENILRKLLFWKKI